jgi:hypothetical protein
MATLAELLAPLARFAEELAQQAKERGEDPAAVARRLTDLTVPPLGSERIIAREADAAAIAKALRDSQSQPSAASVPPASKPSTGSISPRVAVLIEVMFELLLRDNQFPRTQNELARAAVQRATELRLWTEEEALSEDSSVAKAVAKAALAGWRRVK